MTSAIFYADVIVKPLTKPCKKSEKTPDFTALGNRSFRLDPQKGQDVLTINAPQFGDI